MQRIKLQLTTNFSFATFIKIRVTDLNYGGHVGNDSFLSLLHEARQQYLLSFNYSELSLAGTSLIMTDVAIEFKKQLHYADNVRISVQATAFDTFGFDLHYLMEAEELGSFVLAAKAKTGMLCYDYAAGKVVKLPEEALQNLRNLG